VKLATTNLLYTCADGLEKMLSLLKKNNPNFLTILLDSIHLMAYKDSMAKVFLETKP